MGLQWFGRVLGRFGAGALLMLASVAAAQGGPRSYAVVSELAREVSVNIFQEATGSRIDANSHQRIAVPDGALDKVVLVSARAAVNQAEAGAGVWLIAPTDSNLFDTLQSATAGDRVAIPDDLAAALREKGSTHLLLFTRFRAEAQLQAAHTRVGSGRLEGLGFFVDRHMRAYIAETGQHSKGFLAPYVYIRASLIDTRTAQVVRTRTATAGRAYSNPDTTAGTHVWDIWTSAEKMNRLRDVLQKEISQLVPALITAP